MAVSHRARRQVDSKLVRVDRGEDLAVPGGREVKARKGEALVVRAISKVVLGAALVVPAEAVVVLAAGLGVVSSESSTAKLYGRTIQ